MTKTFSPELEATLDEAIDAPLILSAPSRPSSVALSEELFDTLIEASEEDAARFEPRVIHRESKPTIVLLPEALFDQLRAAFEAATAGLKRPSW